MKSATHVALFAACLLGTYHPTQSRADEPKVDRPFGELIEQLNSEDFKERELATAEIWRIGSEHQTALEEAAKSDEPEIAIRVTEVLRKLELRIFPETDELILSLIGSFEAAAIKQKSLILRQLIDKEAFFQALKLYSKEGEESRRQLASAVYNVGLRTAFAAMAIGDRAEAISLLRMSSGSYSEILALAHLYHVERDSGAEDLEWIGPINVPQPQWETIIQLVGGDLKRAGQMASDNNLKALSAAVMMFLGDPTPWLELSLVNGNFNLQDQRAVSLHAEFALKKWNGEELDESDIERLAERLENKQDVQDTRQAAAALAIFGRLDLVEKIEAEDKLEATFIGRFSQNKDDAALALIGLKSGDRDFKKFVTDILVKSDDVGLSDLEIKKLSLLTYYLEFRGEKKTIQEAIIGPFLKFGEVNEKAFLGLVDTFTQGGSTDLRWRRALEMPVIALEIGAAWAADDMERWQKVAVILDQFISKNSAGGKVVESTRKLMARVSPDLDEKERIELTLNLFGFERGTGAKKQKWIEDAFKTISAIDDKAERKELLTIILTIAAVTGEVDYSIRAWDELDDPTAGKEVWYALLTHFTIVDRWADAADLIKNFGGENLMAKMLHHAYLGIALEREGKRAESVKELKMAEELTMADSSQCELLSEIYQQAGRFDDATKWMKKAVLYSDMNNSGYLNKLGDFILLNKSQRKWEAVAACQAVYNCQKLLIDFTGISFNEFYGYGYDRDISNALRRLDKEKEVGLAEITALHAAWVSHGALGDALFPELRIRGFKKELNEMFTESWDVLLKLETEFPNDHNLKNTLGWLASRASLKLDEAEDFMKGALKLAGQNPAYLDTMAEVYFAKGNRKLAIEWSDEATRKGPNDLLLRQQNHRFRTDKMRK